ncbi:MAG: tRNA (guanosine(37)-N1)-methyltransferase TrmD [Pseudomonadota bacterium]
MIAFDILTLFPNMFSSPLNESVLKRAQEEGLIEIRVHNIRDFTSDRHHTADDYPYGGGRGMVMKPEPIIRAIEKVRSTLKESKVILMTPQGRRFDQEYALRLSKLSHLIIICGRYEGIDERVREYVDEEISIGDYVLSGGELGALVLLDTVARLIPGVLGNPESAGDESFCNWLLEYPQYTRPREYRGSQVPEVLVSGNHKRIDRWRRVQSLKRTRERRPDLLKEAKLSDEDIRALSHREEE